MVLSDAESIGKYLVNLKKEIEGIKSNALPEEVDQSLNLVPFDSVGVRLEPTANKLYYPTDSFVIDHPIYGDIDSSTLLIDGGHATTGYVNGTVGYYPLDAQPASGVVYDEKEGGTAYNGTYQIEHLVHYSFNGNANDSSVNGNDGTVVGATLTYDHLGQSDNAYYFDGSGSYISCDPGIASSTGALTIGGWFNSADNTLTSQPFGLKGEAFGMVLYNKTLSRVDARRAATGGSDLTGRFNITSPYSIKENTWYFVLITQSTDFTVVPEVYIAEKGASTLTKLTAHAGTPFAASANTEFEVGRINPTGTDFKGTVSSCFMAQAYYTEAEANRYFLLTSSHKFDQPLVTKTDINGDSITGFDLFSSASGKASINQVVVADNSDFDFSGSFSIYTKVLLQKHISSTAQYILGKYPGAAPDFYLYYDPTNKKFVTHLRDSAGTAVGASSSNNSVSENTIYHLIFEYDTSANTHSLYINGVLAQNVSAVLNDNFTNADPFHIGFRRSTTDCGFNGIIGNTILFNRTLTSTEKTNLSSGIYPKEKIILS